MSLEALEHQVRCDLARLEYPRRAWVPPHDYEGQPVLNVLIVGAGQSGLSAASALQRERVDRVLVVDAKPPGREGPWMDFARMMTLRTPKHVTGPDLGLPCLTFQAWYEAQWGSQAWEDLRLIPKELWAEYLGWYRRVLALPVRNNCSVTDLEWDESAGSWKVSARGPEGPETLRARKIILATGIDGSGRWEVPESVRDLPRRFWAHTHEPIDFERLRGLRVGVLGAGASAFDNASVALEQGAAQVALFFRRKTLVNVNPYRWAEFTGFLKHHASLDDAARWKFMTRFVRIGQLPPADTLARAQNHSAFSLNPDSPWLSVRDHGETVVVTTPHSSFEFDFLILGTGFVTDLSLRPELSRLAPHVALWKDRYTPPPGEEFEDLARYPYLGPGGEFVAKNPSQTPWVSSVFCYTYAGLPSLGFAGAFISGLKYSLPRLIDAVTAQLYRDDQEHFYQTLEDYHVTEF